MFDSLFGSGVRGLNYISLIEPIVNSLFRSNNELFKVLKFNHTVRLIPFVFQAEVLDLLEFNLTNNIN